MRKEVLICDKCKKQKASVQNYYWKTGTRTLDASGNGYDDEYSSVDLCKQCVTEIVELASKTIDLGVRTGGG